MAGASLTVALSGQTPRIFLRSQKMRELVFCASSSIQSQPQCQMSQSSRRSSCTSSPRIIRYGQLRQNSSITVSQPHHSRRIRFSIMRACQCQRGSCVRPLSTSSRTLRSGWQSDFEYHQISSPSYGEFVVRLKWGAQEVNHGDRHG